MRFRLQTARPPKLTDGEWKAVYHAASGLPWIPDVIYDDLIRAVKKMRAYLEKKHGRLAG